MNEDVEENRTEQKKLLPEESKENYIPFRIPADYLLNSPQQDFWLSVVLGAGIAEAVGGGLFVLPFYVLQDVALGFPTEIMGIAFLFFYKLILFATLCFMVSSVIGFFSCAACDMLKINSESLTTGAVTGGTVGLSLTVLWWLWNVAVSTSVFLQMVAATILGQFGGAYGAWRVLAQQRSSKDMKNKGRHSFRFNMRQLFTVTTCSAVLLTLMKGAGMLTVSFALFLGTWVVLQILGVIVTSIASRKGHQPKVIGRST